MINLKGRKATRVCTQAEYGLFSSKRSQEMSIGTIVVIILALIVLVLLIMGFTMGWSNLWDKITNLGGGGQSNVDTIVTACNIACTTSSNFEYCRQRAVNFGKGSSYEGKVITDAKNITNGKINANCLELKNAIPELQIDCTSITSCA